MTTLNAVPSLKRGPYAKSARRRESILRAAHEVFAGRGYRGGSLQEVAERAGMSQTSLLHYFPTKRDLLLAVLRWRDTTIRGGLPPDPSETLEQAVLRQARFNESVPGVIELYTVLCAESLTEGHPGVDYFTERFERLRHGFTRDFKALAEAGRLRPGIVPERAAATLIALWDGIQTQWLMAPEGVDMAGCLRDYLDLVIVPE